MLRLILLCLLSFPAWATDYYAAPGGGAAASCVNDGANVCTVARCITVATTGDTCLLSAGTYPGSELGGSGYVIQTSEFVNLDCVGADGSCIFTPAGTNISGIRLNTPVAGGTITFDGIYIDGTDTTPLDQCFYYNDAASHYTVTSTGNTCKNADIYGHRVVANEMTLTSTDEVMIAESTVSPRSFLATIGTWAEGAMSIDGANVRIDKYNDTSVPVVNILATDTGESGSVTDSTFTIVNDPDTTTGYIDVIRFQAIPSAVATGNTITVTGANVGTVGAQCDASVCRHVRGIRSFSNSALTSANANLSNNTITIEAANGQLISVGQDGTTAGDTYSSDGVISGNTLTCTTSETSAHGVFFGWSANGRGERNYVKNCGIGLLSKSQPTAGATFSGNIVNGAWESYIYSKGSTAPKFYNNTLAVSNTAGTPVVIGIESAKNSTNVELYNNLIFSTDGSTPTDVLNTASAQTIAAASHNDWYGFTSPQWTYLGVAYASLALWNAVAAVGDDITANPYLSGGAAPTSSEGFRLLSGSLARRVGTHLNIGNIQDHGNRAFSQPPSIGAWEAASGDIATTRTAVSTRTAATTRTAASARTAR